MKKIYIYILSFLISSQTLLAGAGEAKFKQGVNSFVNKINDIFLKPILTLLVALSVIYFVWGLAVFISRTNEDTERQKARQHMLWGIIGLFIIFSVWGIMNIIMDTVNYVGN